MTNQCRCEWHLPPSLAPSPLQPLDSCTASPSYSPSCEPPLLYVQFHDQDMLNVPGTLLVIAWRFKKLKKWTVGHVRALKEHMGNVKRWLVEKESNREGQVENTTTVNESSSSALEGTMNEMRDELMEMQGHIGELGHKVVKFVTSPGICLPCLCVFQPKLILPPLRQTHHSRFMHRRAPPSRSTHILFCPITRSPQSLASRPMATSADATWLACCSFLPPPSALNSHAYASHTQWETTRPCQAL